MDVTKVVDAEMARERDRTPDLSHHNHPPDPRLVELVEWLRRVLMVREVRGSIPYSGHFRVDHFRNVQHNTKVPISYMVAQVGVVLLPYGPGLVSWETYVLLRPYV